MEKTQKDFPLIIREKKSYLSPTLDVMNVEMECGIAANSAPVYPGNTNQVQTDWEGEDNTTINVPF